MKKIYLIATLAGLVMALAIFLFTKQIEEQVRQSDEPVKVVVTAASSIAENTILTEEMLSLKEIPEKAVLADTAVNIEELVGRIVKYPLVQGEQIIQSKLDLVGSDEADGLSAQLTSGQRAVTIPVPGEDIGVAGFIRKGDTIDIIITTNENGQRNTFIFMQNVKVLKVSNRAANNQGKDILDYGTITLVVSPQEAVELSDMVLTSPYRFSLRSLAEGTAVGASKSQ